MTYACKACESDIRRSISNMDELLYECINELCSEYGLPKPLLDFFRATRADRAYSLAKAILEGRIDLAILGDKMGWPED